MYNGIDSMVHSGCQASLISVTSLDDLPADAWWVEPLAVQNQLTERELKLGYGHAQKNFYQRLAWSLPALAPIQSVNSNSRDMKAR